MWFSTRKFIFYVAVIAAAAMTGLLFIQLQWLQRGVELHEAQLDNKMSMVVGSLYSALSEYEDEFNEELENLEEFRSLFENENLTSVSASIIQLVVDSVFRVYEVPSKYKIYGEMSTGYCPLMREGNVATLEDPLGSFNYRLCLCPDMRIPGTIDFGFNFINERQFLLQKTKGMLIPSLLFILLLIGSLIYMIKTILRQTKLSKLKDDFINNLTHEFKTPIFSIGISSKILSEREEIKKSDSLTSFVDLIRNETDRLKIQVDNILQLAVINSGKFSLDKSTFAISEVIEKVLASFKIAVESKNGQINYKAENDLPLLYADKNHITNIVYNLVDNALKYSKDCPDIRLLTFRENGYLEIRIEDSGVGMDESTLKQVYDRFYRQNNSTGTQTNGFGLGLSYVKYVIEMHSGTITAKSKKGIGSQFTIRLPLHQEKKP